VEPPPVLDVEVLDGVGPAEVADCVLDALDELAAHGHRMRPLLYGGPGLLAQLPASAMAEAAKIADLWVAHLRRRLASPPSRVGPVDVLLAVHGDRDDLRGARPARTPTVTGLARAAARGRSGAASRDL